MKLYLFALLLCSQVHAAIPTVEGLFRNPSNPDLVGDTVVLKLNVKEVDKANDKVIEGFYKFIFYKKIDSKRISLLQIEYTEANMNSENLLNAKLFKNFGNKYLKNSGLSTELFYSLITMFSLNSSSGISNLLVEHGNNYQKNSDLMDKDKVSLMRRYKKYLSKLKDDDSDKDNLMSPMKPSNEDDMLKVKKILTKSMYKDNGVINLERKNGKFYWQVELENIHALFENVNHNLLYLQIKDNSHSIKSYFRDYLLFDGKHQLPKNIRMILGKDKFYEIRILKYQNFDSKNKSIKVRYKEYQEKLKKIVKIQMVRESVAIIL